MSKPMTVHDALQAWSDRRLTTEEALELTGCADEAELRQACWSSNVRPRPVLYSVEDGPGAGRFVDVVVRVMVGTQRGTVLVERNGEPASLREVREHGHEVDGLGARRSRQPYGRASRGNLDRRTDYLN